MHLEPEGELEGADQDGRGAEAKQEGLAPARPRLDAQKGDQENRDDWPEAEQQDESSGPSPLNSPQMAPSLRRRGEAKKRGFLKRILGIK